MVLCVCVIFFNGCYNTEPRENVLKYIIGPTTLMRMCWRNFPGGTKNRRGKIYGLSIRLLTSMKSC